MTISLRLKLPSKKRLEKLAERTGRSRSFLAMQAIDDYLDAQEWQVEGIRASLRSADAGRVVDHSRVAAWAASWGSKKEKAVPKPV